MRRGRAPIKPHLLRIVALIACSWGLVEVGFTTEAFSDYNRAHDDVVPIVQHIKQTPPAVDAVSPLSPLVFTTSIALANNLPTYSQPILWGTHVPNFPGISTGECQERAFQFYYYAGSSPDQLRQLLAANQFDAVNAIFGLERAVPVLTAHPVPVSTIEIDQAVLLDGHIGDAVPILFEALAGVEHGLVLGNRGDNVVTLLAIHLRHTLDGEVVTLGGA